MRKTKGKAPNHTIQRFLSGAPPGTRTLGPLIKRNRNAFFVQPGIQRKSVVFIQSPLFYLFLSIAFFAPCARLCIQFPALRCAENVQRENPFHSVPARGQVNWAKGTAAQRVSKRSGRLFSSSLTGHILLCNTPPMPRVVLMPTPAYPAKSSRASANCAWNPFSRLSNQSAPVKPGTTFPFRR